MVPMRAGEGQEQEVTCPKKEERHSVAEAQCVEIKGHAVRVKRERGAGQSQTREFRLRLWGR